MANSDKARAVIGTPERAAYGPSEIEKLDIYRTKRANAPVNIFIHGGAWRANRAADYACLAEPFVTAGAHYVILDFTNVDDAGGSLIPMVEQVRRAVGWVYKNAKSFGGDPDRLYLTSHSSGSHLGGCVVTHDWRKDGLPVDILKGAVLSSGMYDLKPVRLSKRSKYVNFTDEMEEALSAQRHIDRLNLPLILAYGTYETPEFQRQTRDFASGGEGGRQAGRAAGRRRLQPLRDAGDAGKSLRPARPRCAGADGTDANGVSAGESPANGDLAVGAEPAGRTIGMSRLSRRGCGAMATDLGRMRRKQA